MQGKIVRIISNQYTILADRKYECRVRGKFRNLKITPVVGDNVIFDEKKLIIEEILNRKNYLIRPLVSNIDQCLIVASVKKPDLDLYLLDKLLCIVEFNNIKPIICFTKLDLLNDLAKINEIKDYYTKIGYQVFYNNEIEKIKPIFNGKITVFTGQSGAGKSTLLNLIDPSLSLKTDEISIALGRGKHTTRHVELIELEHGMCVDTPGFSLVSFNEMTSSDVRDNMIEFNQFKSLCAYRDCMHDEEVDCEIKRQVNNEILKTRYDNYLKYIKNDIVKRR